MREFGGKEKRPSKNKIAVQKLIIVLTDSQ
jgi:hypothetical protein